MSASTWVAHAQQQQLPTCTSPSASAAAGFLKPAATRGVAREQPAGVCPAAAAASQSWLLPDRSMASGAVLAAGGITAISGSGMPSDVAAAAGAAAAAAVGDPGLPPGLAAAGPMWGMAPEAGSGPAAAGPAWLPCMPCCCCWGGSGAWFAVAAPAPGVPAAAGAGCGSICAASESSKSSTRVVYLTAQTDRAGRVATL